MLLLLLSGCALWFDGKSDPGFDITLRYEGWTPSDAEAEAIQRAVARWEAVIREDIPDEQVTLTQETIDAAPGGVPCAATDEVVDDLLVYVVLDQSLGERAASQQCLIRQDAPYLPKLGGIYLTDAFLEGGVFADLLEPTVAHELGHILGLRRIGWNLDEDGDGSWERLLVPGREPDCPASEQVFYEGARGVAAWQQLGGTGFVPLEDEGPEGTRCEHWDSSVFGNELMTGGGIDPERPMSLVTIEAIADLGYTVDTSLADPFELLIPGEDTGTPEP